MSPKGKKILLIILVVIVIIIALILFALWKAGIFAQTTVSLQERGPYYYVFMEKTGPFTEIPKAYKEVEALFAEQNLTSVMPCGVYLDDPSEVEQNELRWKAGFIVSDSIMVNEPLIFEIIPGQLFIVGAIKAHPMVAPFKTYPAIHKWVAENDYDIKGHAYELHGEDGLIEVMFPAVKKE